MLPGFRVHTALAVVAMLSLSLSPHNAALAGDPIQICDGIGKHYSLPPVPLSTHTLSLSLALFCFRSIAHVL